MANHSEAFKNAIKEYLESFAKENKSFAEKYTNPKKNIDGCCSFIVSSVKKMGVSGLDDGEVYYLARHYYEEEKLEIDSSIQCNVVVNKKIEITEEEKQRAKEEALKEYKKEILEKERNKQLKQEQAEKRKQELAVQKEEKKKQKQIEKGFAQMDLFGDL